MVRSTQRGGRGSGLLPVALFQISGAALLVLRNPEPGMLLAAFSLLLILFLASRVLVRVPRLDGLLLNLSLFLITLGILVLSRMDPGKGLMQALNSLAGFLAMAGCYYFLRFRSGRGFMILLSALASLGLMALPLLFGTEKNGALAWVSVAGISFQPSEVVKLALVLVLARLLSERRMILASLFAGACLLLLFLQKDLGSALLYYLVALVMAYSATGRLLVLGVGAAGAGAAAVLGYNMFSHVKKRVRIFINPFNDYRGEGYQIVQSLIAIVNGGLWGAGLGAGSALSIPEYATDFIFPVIVNEFGMLFGVCVIAVYLLILLRGAFIAQQARNRFEALLAQGAASFITLQSIVIIGGNIKMIPLTGVTLPFVSYGGTSLLSSLGLIGLLMGVSANNADGLLEDERLARMAEDAL